MTKQSLRSRKPLVIIITFVIALIAIAAGLYVFWTAGQQAKDQVTTTDEPSVRFTFDKSSAPGWSSTGNLSPRTKEQPTDPTTGDDLPFASLVAHQGDMKKPSACFISYAYYDTPIDVKKALRDAIARTTSGSDSLSLKKLRTQSLAVTTPEGTKDYQLMQYEITGSYGGQLMRGLELSYISLADGHIKIDGHCNTAKQLKNTIQPLSSVSLTRS